MNPDRKQPARCDSFTRRQAVTLSCLLLAALLMGRSLPAQGVTGSPNDIADPYQIVSPASGGGLVRLGSIFQTSGPSVTTLNQPIVAAPIPNPNGLFNQPVFPGGPLSQNWQPYFPQVRETLNDRLYVLGEFLVWDVTGMDIPAMVTTSSPGTPRELAGVLGAADTTTVFGPGEINDGTTGGFRWGAGLWVTPAQNVAIEGEFLWLGDQDDGFSAAGSGDAILARPFFDIVAGRETAQLIAFPDLVSGNIVISSESEFRSFLINGRVAVVPTHGDPCQQCGMRDRTDWIIGYRNLRLRDSIQVSENLTSEIPAAPGTIAVSDEFQTTNQFNGLQLGIVHRACLREKAWLESMLRVAIGNNQQDLSINGSTQFTEAGVTDSEAGGLYALRSNIGTFQRDEFVMIPELGLRLGVQLTRRFRATAGYSVVYVPNVIRASEQIDTDINPNLVPDEISPLVGDLRPRVLWVQNDYLAHGLSFGGELHF